MSDKKADIFMLVSNEVTGDPRVRKEAFALSAAGYNVAVAGLRTDKRTETVEVFDGGYRVVRCDVAGITSFINRFISILSGRKPAILFRIFILALKIIKKVYHHWKLFFIAGKLKARVYHAHDLDTLPAAWWAYLRNKGTLVYDSHELWIEQREDFPVVLKKIFKYLEHFLIARASSVITVDDSIAEELSRRYKIKKPYVIRNFSPLKKDINPAPLEEIIKVLYHGGYIGGRGLEEIISSVRYWDEGVELYLRGYGPLEKVIKEMVKEHGLSGKVHFVEPVPMDRLIEEACFAHIGILPYKPTCLNNLYSLPNKLFEYMMAGLAVVASDLPEIKRINNEVGFGILFDPYDPEAIARSVNLLARDRKYLEECRRKGQEWSRAVGNWETESEKLIDLYNSLLPEREKCCNA